MKKFLDFVKWSFSFPERDFADRVKINTRRRIVIVLAIIFVLTIASNYVDIEITEDEAVASHIQKLMKEKGIEDVGR